MKDWPEHASTVEGEAAGGGGSGAEAVSTLQQLEGRAVATMDENQDDGSPGSFRDDFIGGEVGRSQGATTSSDPCITHRIGF